MAKSKTKGKRRGGRRPPFRLPGGQTWAQVVTGALDGLAAAGVADLPTLYGLVATAIGETPLSPNHRAKVRQIVSIEPTIARLGNGRYGRIRNPATQEPLEAAIDPTTGNKVDPLETVGPAALPNQTVLDDLMDAMRASTTVVEGSFSARITPIGQGPTPRLSEHHFYDLLLLSRELSLGLVVEMEDLAELFEQYSRLDNPAFVDALGDATARLMRHGYSGPTRVSIRVAELIQVTDIWGGVSYFWGESSPGRAQPWVTIVYADNPRIAAGQIRYSILDNKRGTIYSLNKYMKESVAIHIPAEVSFIISVNPNQE